MSSALGVLIPPLRFSVVAAVGPSLQAESLPATGLLDSVERRRQARQAQTIYCGTYPKPRNLPFLSRLYLRTILSLTPKPPAEIGFGPAAVPTSDVRTGAAPPGGALKAWAESEGIRLIHIRVPSAKDRSPATLPAEDAQRVLDAITDPANLPIYIHCLDGVEVTALSIALFRKTQRWHPRAILEEYCRRLRDPMPTAPSDISTYIAQFEVGPRPEVEGEEDEDEEEDEEDEEEDEEDDEEGSDDALEALDLEGY